MKIYREKDKVTLTMTDLEAQRMAHILFTILGTKALIFGEQTRATAQQFVKVVLDEALEGK